MTAGANPPGTGRQRRVGRKPVLLTGLILAAVVAGAIYPLLSRLDPDGPAGPVRLRATLTVSKFGDWLGPLEFSPDGKTIAALGIVTAYLYNPATLRRTGIWTAPDPHHNEPTSLAFGPAGKTLIISDGGRHSAFVWNLAAGAVTATFPNPRNARIYNTALSPDGKLMAESSDWAGHALLWNMATRRYTAVLINPGFGVDPLAFSPDSTTLAVGDAALGHGKRFGQIALWNLERRRIRASYQTPDHTQVQAVAFSPDGALLAAAGARSIYLWDVTTGQRAGTLTGPRGTAIRDIALSPGGRTLAAIFDNNTAYIWNLRTTKIIAALPDPDNTEIASLAYSPDGKTLAIGDYISHIFLWDVSQTDPPART